MWEKEWYYCHTAGIGEAMCLTPGWILDGRSPTVVFVPTRVELWLMSSHSPSCPFYFCNKIRMKRLHSFCRQVLCLRIPNDFTLVILQLESTLWSTKTTLITVIALRVCAHRHKVILLSLAWLHVSAGYSLRPFVALLLAVNGWQCWLTVKLQSFSQGLPYLLCVCKHIVIP